MTGLAGPAVAEPAGPGRASPITVSSTVERPAAFWWPRLHSCDGKTATTIGTAGADTLWGTPGSDVIVALGGNDSVRGLGGADTICGGSGTDIVLGDVQ